MRQKRPPLTDQERATLAEVAAAVEACLAHGYTLSSLGRELGVSHVAIRTWRDGGSMPGLHAGRRLLALAERLRSM